MALAFKSGGTCWKRQRVEMKHQLCELNLELALQPTLLYCCKMRVCCSQSRIAVQGMTHGKIVARIIG
jgi:hypothetical protein